MSEGRPLENQYPLRKWDLFTNGRPSLIIPPFVKVDRLPELNGGNHST